MTIDRVAALAGILAAGGSITYNKTEGSIAALRALRFALNQMGVAFGIATVHAGSMTGRSKYDTASGSIEESVPQRIVTT